MSISAPALRVYRSGPVNIPVHGEVVARLYGRADSARPPGRIGRSQAIFCSPTLLGASRWMSGNLFAAGPSADVSVREIRLVNDTRAIYAYPVSAWDHASRTGASEADLRAYWAAGVPIKTWFAKAGAEGLDARHWEVLVPKVAIAGVRPVSDARVLASIPAGDLNWTRSALESELRRASRLRR